MSANLYLAKISKIDGGVADITIPDRNRQVVTDVPFLESVKEKPSVGDAVFAVIEEGNRRMGRAVILGRFSSKENESWGSGGAG